jgi:hypothetical protein
MAELLVIDKRRLAVKVARRRLAIRSVNNLQPYPWANRRVILQQLLVPRAVVKQTHGGGKLRRALHADRKELKP